MRETAKNTVDKVTPTQHAIEQFIARSGSKRSPDQVAAKLKRMLTVAQEVRKKDATLTLLNNGCANARYFRCKTWVLVVVDDRIVTCYQPRMKEFTDC
ncbi:MAG: hypothetical protein D6800_09790 [Candidatus Zixiibacteriota bacterium]|nr:MAG: hypothetical protein D6800_09790 [candidate division Zixibacteria bacterium]